MSGTAATENLPVGIDERRELFTKMVESRLFEEEAERQYKAAKIGGYCHLSSGQEAATVGSVAALEDDDYLVTGYRCHGFALARGIPPGEVMAELFKPLRTAARVHLSPPSHKAMRASASGLSEVFQRPSSTAT